MSEKKVLEIIQVENFLKYIRKKRVWVCFICNGVDVHMICKKMNDIGVDTWDCQRHWIFWKRKSC